MAEKESKEAEIRREIKRLEIEVALYELRARRVEAVLRLHAANAKLKETNAEKPKDK